MEGEGLGSTTGPKKVVGSIDLKEWLTKHKLTKAYESLQKREVTIEELVDFNDDELIELAKSIGLDTLQRRRLVKGINSLQQQKKNTTNTTNYGETSSLPQTLGSNLSKSQQRVGNNIINKHNKLVSLEKELTNNLKLIDNSYNSVSVELNKLFDNLSDTLNSKQKELIEELDLVKNKKIETYKKQLNDTKNYLSKLDNMKSKIENSVKDTNRSTDEIVKSCNLLLKENVSENVLTKSEFKILNKNEFNKYLEKEYKIDSCDVPYVPIFKLLKQKDDYYKFELKMNDKQPNFIQPIDKYELAYVCYYTKKEKKDKKKKKSKKRKRKKRRKKKDSSDSDSDSDSSNSDSDSDSSSNSDSNSDSDSSSDSDSDSSSSEKNKKSKKNKKKDKSEKKEDSENDEKEKIPEEIDESILKSLKWKTKKIESDIKSYKFDTEKIKYSSIYLFKLRAKNRNGWSEYSDYIKIKTPEGGEFNSKIMSPKEEKYLAKIIKAQTQKQRRFKLLYRATRDGFEAQSFHRKCDGKGWTVTIIKSQYGNIYGGFTKIAWTTTSDQYQYKVDTSAFLFLLKSGVNKNLKMPKTYLQKNNNNGTYAVCHSGQHGPKFGGGHDISIVSGCNKRYTDYNSFGFTYVGGNKVDLTGANNNNFYVTNYEVYLVK